MLQSKKYDFFFYGETPSTKIFHLAQKYFLENKESFIPIKSRITPKIISSQNKKIKKKLNQSHIIIGSRGYDRYNEKKIGLYLLSNLLGGSNMNSRLNVSLRETHGLVYIIESNSISYSDTGCFNIYFSCDSKVKDKCINLTYKELKKLCNKKLNTLQLHIYAKQLKGKLGIENENKENFALRFGKNLLHLNKYDTLSNIYKKIDMLKSSDLLEIANEIFDEKKIFQLIFE
ncbi:MAG: insulinase family protein [Bacteroidales bacterium OttesenSCG-928-I14]|nr:insulinase family protein [Bacteroidales bacterium OttesenSCG-928-I14]